LTLVVRLQSDGTRICGLHRYDAPDRVFDLEECPISKPQIVSAVVEVRRAAHLLPEARQLRVTLRSHREGILMVLEGMGQWASRERFRSACPSLVKVVWGLPRPAPGTAGTASQAAESIVFEQVNPAVAKLLRELLVEWVLQAGPRTIVDAYCGTGETAGALSQRGIQVIGIERQPEAAALAAARLPRGRVITAPVEDALASVLPADVVIVNPPRSGLSRQVTEILGNANAASRILYVSCDPATLARDLSRLPSYRVERLVCFDMFPQTAHLETVCELVREA
jgi:23S rRNA (uracil1939-C5)-methyltransferase